MISRTGYDAREDPADGKQLDSQTGKDAVASSEIFPGGLRTRVDRQIVQAIYTVAVWLARAPCGMAGTGTMWDSKDKHWGGAKKVPTPRGVRTPDLVSIVINEPAQLWLTRVRGFGPIFCSILNSTSRQFYSNTFQFDCESPLRCTFP